MKEGWINRKLGDICEFKSGFTPKKEELNSVGGIPYYKVSDMNRATNVLYMSETELYVKKSKKIIPANSIVFPKNGGAIFTGKKRILSYDSIVDLNTEAISIKRDDILLRYLYLCLQGINFGQFDNGGGLPSLNIKKMKEFTIPVPSLSEQQRIVELLDAEFAKIDAIKANAEQQLQAAKDLFQATLKDMLTPKEGWEEKKLRDISLSVKDGDWIEKKDQSLSGIRLIQTGNIGIGIYKDKSDTAHYISNETFSRLHCEEVFAGDVLISRLPDPVGRACLIPQMENRCITAVDCSIIKLNEKIIIPRYFLLYTQTREYFSKISSLCTGSTRLRISRKKIVEVTIPIPSLSEQIVIADKLDEISDKVKELQSNYTQTLTLCNDLKQALLKSIFE